MNLYLSTVSYLIGIMVGIIYYLDGWGPTWVRGGFPSSRRYRGLLTVIGGGVISPLLDKYLLGASKYHFFMGYLYGVASGWLILFVIATFLYVVWVNTRESDSSSVGYKFGQICHSIIEAVYVGIRENPLLERERKRQSIIYDIRVEKEIERLQEELKEKNPQSYMKFRKDYLQPLQDERWSNLRQVYQRLRESYLKNTIQILLDSSIEIQKQSFNEEFMARVLIYESSRRLLEPFVVSRNAKDIEIYKALSFRENQGIPGIVFTNARKRKDTCSLYFDNKKILEDLPSSNEIMETGWKHLEDFVMAGILSEVGAPIYETTSDKKECIGVLIYSSNRRRPDTSLGDYTLNVEKQAGFISYLFSKYVTDV